MEKFLKQEREREQDIAKQRRQQEKRKLRTHSPIRFHTHNDPQQSTIRRKPMERLLGFKFLKDQMKTKTLTRQQFTVYNLQFTVYNLQFTVKIEENDTNVRIYFFFTKNK